MAGGARMNAAADRDRPQTATGRRLTANAASASRLVTTRILSLRLWARISARNCSLGRADLPAA
jgi:hypothetical protein